MNRVIVFVKPGCEKCIIAKELAEKLKEKYSVKVLSIDTLEGLTELSYLGIQYPPAIVHQGKIYRSIKQAEKELLKEAVDDK